MSISVLTQNVKLFFECENCKGEPTESSPIDLCVSGVPICPDCQEEMELSDQALIIN
jgi:hypothetical protein